MTPQCAWCHRFVSVKTAAESIEYGDYGTVHSVEYLCPSCVKRALEPLRQETEQHQDTRTEAGALMRDFTRLGEAFVSLYLQALNGVVCDPTGEPGTRNCCQPCVAAWEKGRNVLGKYDPDWGNGFRKGSVFQPDPPALPSSQHVPERSPEED